MSSVGSPRRNARKRNPPATRRRSARIARRLPRRLHRGDLTGAWLFDRTNGRTS